MLAATWKDKRVVNVLSTVPCDDSVVELERTQKKKNGGVEEIVVKKPKVVDLYNRNMGGVDLSDQRVSYYRRHMKSLTWYMQLFFSHAEPFCCSGIPTV